MFPGFPLRAYLCVEEQVFPDGEVVKHHVVLRTQSQALADQSHVLADVVAVDVCPATGGGVQTWEGGNIAVSE